MTQFQVRPESPEQSRVIQEALFGLGYRWFGEDGDSPQYLSERVLFCKDNGRITYGNVRRGDEKISGYRMASIPKILAEAEKRRNPPKPTLRPLVHEHPSMESIKAEPTPEEPDAVMSEVLSRPEVQAALQSLSAAFGMPPVMGEMPKTSPVDISGMMGGRFGEDRDYEVIDDGVAGKGPEAFQPVWIVWNPSGFHAPKKEHKSRWDAEFEAERLINKQPGDVFYVMRAEKKYTASVTVKCSHALA